MVHLPTFIKKSAIHLGQYAMQPWIRHGTIHHCRSPKTPLPISHQVEQTSGDTLFPIGSHRLPQSDPVVRAVTSIYKPLKKAMNGRGPTTPGLWGLTNHRN